MDACHARVLECTTVIFLVLASLLGSLAKILRGGIFGNQPVKYGARLSYLPTISIEERGCSYESLGLSSNIFRQSECHCALVGAIVSSLSIIPSSRY